MCLAKAVFVCAAAAVEKDEAVEHPLRVYAEEVAPAWDVSVGQALAWIRFVDANRRWVLRLGAGFVTTEGVPGVLWVIGGDVNVEKSVSVWSEYEVRFVPYGKLYCAGVWAGASAPPQGYALGTVRTFAKSIGREHSIPMIPADAEAGDVGKEFALETFLAGLGIRRHLHVKFGYSFYAYIGVDAVVQIVETMNGMPSDVEGAWIIKYSDVDPQKRYVKSPIDALYWRHALEMGKKPFMAVKPLLSRL